MITRSLKYVILIKLHGGGGSKPVSSPAHVQGENPLIVVGSQIPFSGSAYTSQPDWDRFCFEPSQTGSGHLDPHM